MKIHFCFYITVFSIFHGLPREAPPQIYSRTCKYCPPIMQGRKVRQPLIHTGQTAMPKAQITSDCRV